MSCKEQPVRMTYLFDIIINTTLKWPRFNDVLLLRSMKNTHKNIQGAKKNIETKNASVYTYFKYLHMNNTYILYTTNMTNIWFDFNDVLRVECMQTATHISLLGRGMYDLLYLFTYTFQLFIYIVSIDVYTHTYLQAISDICRYFTIDYFFFLVLFTYILLLRLSRPTKENLNLFVQTMILEVEFIRLRTALYGRLK